MFSYLYLLLILQHLHDVDATHSKQPQIADFAHTYSLTYLRRNVPLAPSTVLLRLHCFRSTSRSSTVSCQRMYRPLKMPIPVSLLRHLLGPHLTLGHSPIVRYNGDDFRCAFLVQQRSGQSSILWLYQYYRVCSHLYSPLPMIGDSCQSRFFGHCPAHARLLVFCLDKLFLVDDD